MSFLDLIYDLPQGAMVEIQLEETRFRGEFNLAVRGGEKNPEVDQVQLDGPIEVATGKQRNGAISVPVKDILNINVVEYGIFKKKREREYEVGTSISPQSSKSKSSKTSNGGKSSISSKKGKNCQEMKDLEPIEIMLRTYVIREESKLKLLMKLLKDGVDACGLSFEGQNIGRHGVVSWIVLTAGKTLIPIDIDILSEKMPNLWKTLEKDLFSNPKLVKIMHDSRAAADYLFHAHAICMTNIFDTQVADAIVSFDVNKSAPSQLNPLSDCLQFHNRRIPVEEIEFLRKYEAYDFSTNSPMLKKPLPPPEFLKLCALKVKHLVPLRENLMKKMMEKMTRCTEAHMDSYRNQTKEVYASMSKETRHLPEELLSTLEEDLGQLII